MARIKAIPTALEVTCNASVSSFAQNSGRLLPLLTSLGEKERYIGPVSNCEPPCICLNVSPMSPVCPGRHCFFWGSAKQPQDIFYQKFVQLSNKIPLRYELIKENVDTMEERLGEPSIFALGWVSETIQNTGTEVAKTLDQRRG